MSPRLGPASSRSDAAYVASGPGVELPRRAALRRLGGSGLAAALAITAGRGPARVAAHDAHTTSIPPLLAEWEAAWSRDPGRLAGIYTADAVLDEVPTGAVFTGRDAIASHVADIFAGFPEHSLQVASGFIADNRAALAYVFTGVYTGTLPGLPPGTGQRVSVRGAALADLDGGRIRHEAHYYDAYAFLVQLGVLPAPGAATS